MSASERKRINCEHCCVEILEDDPKIQHGLHSYLCGCCAYKYSPLTSEEAWDDFDDNYFANSDSVIMCTACVSCDEKMLDSKQCDKCNNLLCDFCACKCNKCNARCCDNCIREDEYCYYCDVPNDE